MLSVSRSVLSVSPSITSDYVQVVSYYAKYSFLACWRPGDLNWTYVDSGHRGGVSSMIYHKGRFYYVTYYGEIWSFSVPGPSIPQPIEVEATKLVCLEKWWKCQQHGYLLDRVIRDILNYFPTYLE
ncbi:hypothetical protein T459_22639 [Capsicum annuum]|uniref:KIB1-4 beta-propeller domain-containing protein n=1 Tax=Capsicum annuum TaxID=4072 RepID=A0A2G2YQ79_CAPAN|nr:hypothetical protein FXO37_23811 [Capsicum annuum]PHT71854.1 hypothetical protein T459_22639 [Capsicum annuum]